MLMAMAMCSWQFLGKGAISGFGLREMGTFILGGVCGDLSGPTDYGCGGLMIEAP